MNYSMVTVCRISFFNHQPKNRWTATPQSSTRAAPSNTSTEGQQQQQAAPAQNLIYRFVYPETGSWWIFTKKLGYKESFCWWICLEFDVLTPLKTNISPENWWLLQMSHFLSKNLGGGVKYFLFSPLFGEDSQFDCTCIYFFKWLETTNQKKWSLLSLEASIR